MIINLLFVYSDKQTRTIGDLIVTHWWGYFIPVLNTFITLMIPLYYIGEYISNTKIIDKIKNIRIK
jgi:hypothetical protein